MRGHLLIGRLLGGAVIAVVLAVGIMASSGCTGTKAAYQAADTLEERAFLAGEHYSAVLKQAADLKDLGVLKGQALAKAQEIEASATPVVLSLGQLVGHYKAARDAESEVALQKALDEAVRLLADLVRTVKGAAGGGT